MKLEDRITQSIDLNSLSSVTRGFSRMWDLFKTLKPREQAELFRIARHLRDRLGTDNYAWNLLIKRIDKLLVMMRKSIK